MRKGFSTELGAVVAGILALIAVVAVVILLTGYKPPEPISQQVGECAMRGIDVSGYDRMAKNASDAASMITVNYRSNKVSPCSVNGNLPVVYDSCFLGVNGSITLQVDETNCNLVDATKR
ncbi:MAG: hypothetical protein J7L23_02220 [Candidatus Diapherotrites archaeon]|nr:hypothetical protein [Candidatus Diapherotrites archaeon]